MEAVPKGGVFGSIAIAMSTSSRETQRSGAGFNVLAFSKGDARLSLGAIVRLNVRSALSVTGTLGKKLRLLPKEHAKQRVVTHRAGNHMPVTVGIQPATNVRTNGAAMELSTFMFLDK